MKATILFFTIISSGFGFAQLKGEYEYHCPPPDFVSDTITDPVREGGPVTVQGLVINEMSGKKLILKPCGLFEIPGDRIITTYGLNTDNPTIYGKYKRSEDTLILRYKHSIQHFNKLAPKRRVKTKLNKVQRLIVQDDGKLESSENCYWEKK